MTEEPKKKVHGVLAALMRKDNPATSTTLANPDEKIEVIERHGQLHNQESIRLALIGGLQLRPRGWPKTADNLIHIGCLTWGTALALMSYCKLLQRLGEQYFFLRKEYCCGAPLLLGTNVRGSLEDEVAKSTAACRDFTGRNLSDAAQLGAKRIYYLCSWCAYVGRRFHGEEAIPQYYHLDLLVDILKRRKVAMRLDARVAYFSGGQHRRTAYVPNIKWDYDWPSYRHMLDLVDGLTVVDMPKYCCVTHPEAINRVLEQEKVDTLVTPCLTCYGRMLRKAPDGVRVISISELLLEAMDNAEKGE